MKKFISFDDPAAQFGWDVLAATFVYSANRIPEACADIAQIDRGMRWGYAWDLGPFELWDALGVKETVARMKAEGRAVPDWVLKLADSDHPYFYKKEPGVLKAWGPGQTEHKALASRKRVISLADLKATGKTLEENEHAALVDLGDRVACVEFRTKANTVGEGVQLFIQKAIEQAGGAYDALVIGNQGPHFSAGADIKMMVDLVQAGDFDAIERLLKLAQKTNMAVKYSPIPIVAAPFGRVLGGGLELCLHCARVQADSDVGMGLVELGVGLVPAAGGMKEAVIRTMYNAGAVTWPYKMYRRSFDAISQAKVTSSAWEAFDMGYLRQGDGVSMNKEHLIYAAKQTALALVESGLADPAARQDQGHGPRRGGQLPWPAQQHAAGPLHERPRPLSGRQGRLRAFGRRRGPQHRGRRAVPARPGAPGVPRGLPHAQDHRAHAGHADHGQAPPELGCVLVASHRFSAAHAARGTMI